MSLKSIQTMSHTSSYPLLLLCGGVLFIGTLGQREEIQPHSLIVDLEKSPERRQDERLLKAPHLIPSIYKTTNHQAIDATFGRRPDDPLTNPDELQSDEGNALSPRHD